MPKRRGGKRLDRGGKKRGQPQLRLCILQGKRLSKNTWEKRQWPAGVFEVTYDEKEKEGSILVGK